MISFNMLAARQLVVRKGRTLLTGAAIALGVASMFSLLILGASGTAAFERWNRVAFGFADIQVGVDPTVDQKLISHAIEDLPGVKGVALEASYRLRGDFKGDKKEFITKVIDATSSIARELYPLSAGRLPSRMDEIALSNAFAYDEGYRVGETFTLSVAGSADRKLKITGLLNDGGSITSREIRVYVSPQFSPDPKRIGQSLTEDDGSKTIQVILENGAIQKDVAATIKNNIRGVAGPPVTADEQVLANAKRAGLSSSLMFGLVGAISLVVGSTLVYTAFAISATEREREFALIKAVGAERRRIRKLVYREALFLGIMASAAGLALGYALSFAAMSIAQKANLFSGGISYADISVPPQITLISLIAGLGTTLFSVLLPAFRVGKLAPLAAIRQQADMERRVSRVRWIGSPLVMAGMAMLAKATSMPGSERGALLAIGGALVGYSGIAIFLPVLIGPVLGVVERVMVGRMRPAGKLAAKNLGRQSVRSARTITGILTGVSLVCLAAIVSASTVAGARLIIETQVRYDLVISPFPPPGLEGVVIPAKVIDGIEELEDVDFVTTIGSAMVRIDPYESKSAKLVEARVLSLDPERFPKISGLFFDEGVNPDRVWRRLGGKRIIVNEHWDGLKIKPGEKITLYSKDNKPVDFEVIARAEGYIGGKESGTFLLSKHDAERYLGIAGGPIALVKLREGADKAGVTAQVKGLLKGADFEAESGEAIAEEIGRSQQIPTAFIYLIFGVAVLVSLLGVVNTIAIGVLERRREIGLIKAVGGTSRQMRLSILFETLLVSFLGLAFAMAFSTVVAAIFVSTIRASSSDSIIPMAFFTFPTATLVCLSSAVLAASAVGAVFPIRLTSKVTPVEALRLE